MALSRTLFHFFNNPDSTFQQVHSCTVSMQFSTLEFREVPLSNNRLVADTGPAGGKLAGFRVEKC